MFETNVTKRCKRLLFIALEPVLYNLDDNAKNDIIEAAEDELLFHLRIGSFKYMAIHYAICKVTEDGSSLRSEAEFSIRPYNLFVRHLKNALPLPHKHHTTA